MDKNNNQTGMVTLAACMMMKNEEANLPRCLKSLREWVDEIVIVDTGSTDKSIEIAKSFGAKVYNHPFEGDIIDDFSKYRNLAFEYAESDWQMVVDCDEELSFMQDCTPKQLKNFLHNIHKKKQLVAAAVKVEDVQQGNVVMEFNSTRIFKKGEGFYLGIVHNAPQIRSKLGAMYCPFFRIKHYGYDLTPEQKEKKRVRTTTLLMKRLEKDSGDHHVYFYLAQIYADNNDHNQCVKWGEKYLEHKEDVRKTKSFNKSIYFTMVHHYMKMGDKKRAKELIFEGLEELPQDLDLSMALCEFGVWTKDVGMIAMGGKQYLESFDRFQKDPSAKMNRFIYTQNLKSYAYVLYYMSCSMLGDGVKYLHHLKVNVVPKLSKPDAEQVMQDVKKALSASFIEKKTPDRVIKQVKVLDINNGKIAVGGIK